MGGPGVGHILSGHRCAVVPPGGFLEFESDFGAAVIPFKIAVGQQGIELAVNHIIKIGGFEHGDAGIVLLGNRQAVIHISRIGIPTLHIAPLLAVEIQGFIARQCSAGRR